jgi:phosphoglycolate phosphatase-like HAD superfamily hydrolase
MKATIGFDFDMTLVDTSNSLIATLGEIFPDKNIMQDDNFSFQLNGLPLDQILLHFCHKENLHRFRKEFMTAYENIGIRESRLLSGSIPALEIVRQYGFEPVIISAKSKKNLTKLIRHFDLPIKKVHADKHGIEKTKAMIAEKTILYIGDQESDVSAAHAVPIEALRITGNSEVTETHAEWQIDNMSLFPHWFKAWVGISTSK